MSRWWERVFDYWTAAAVMCAIVVSSPNALNHIMQVDFVWWVSMVVGAIAASTICGMRRS